MLLFKVVPSRNHSISQFALLINKSVYFPPINITEIYGQQTNNMGRTLDGCYTLPECPGKSFAGFVLKIIVSFSSKAKSDVFQTNRFKGCALLLTNDSFPSHAMLPTSQVYS